MKSGKRILAGILAAMMVLSSAQFPANVAYAEELPTVQEGVSEGVSASQEDASNQESGQIQENDESQQESGGEITEGKKPDQPGAETPEDVSDDRNPGEEDFAQTELPAEEENPSDPETEKPDGEEQENPEGETVDGNGETDEEFPVYGAQISGNDLQVSGNDLIAAGTQEIWVEAELEGAYQFGGAPAADDGIAAYSESAYTDEEIMDYLCQQMKARVSAIDVSKYEIPYEKTEQTRIQSLFSGALNEHPELYYVGKGFQYSYDGTNILQLMVTYDEKLDDVKWQKGVNAALSVVDESMSDLQKAIVLHDYLTVNCEYDKENLDKNTVPNVSHSTYGVFANRTAVCDGYALSYKYLLKQVGIDCYMVTSDAINHAWNLIKLDGEYYQVDVTWDDPTWDLIGRSVHSFMFRSDANFDAADASQKHTGGRVTYGSQTVNYQATDTRYDNAFWTSCTSPLVLSGNDCYYITYDGTPWLKKGSLENITAPGTKMQSIDVWTAWGSTGYYSSAFSGLFRMNDRLYYNDKSCIYSVAMDGTDQKTEFTADTKDGYIYGSALCQGKVLYSLHQSPNLNQKETVLEADIEVSGVEPEPPIEESKGWNLENLSAEYTALDDTTVSSAAEGRPKLLIFYSNTCLNCRNTISGISGRISNFAGIDICAVETTQKTKDEVLAFQQEFGCEEIVFSYDTGNGNKNSMWNYARAAGFNDSVSWPVICYIDANNRLQYVTMSFLSADLVLYNLKEYCGVSLDGLEFYQITYVLDGGTNHSANPSIYTAETDEVYLWKPTKEGYQFGGWFRDAAFTQQVLSITKGSTGDITLYAKWSPIAAEMSVQRPDKTTYIVGEKIDVTGGKVTYPKDGTATTADMKAEMVSGFDSSKPGICTVTVTVTVANSEYTAEFDTLIVAEPELTAAYRQQLGSVELPENDYGVYSWQDGTQVLDQVGVHTYGAVFTPTDTVKFQKRTDLQISVTVQSTLENGFEVTLKRNVFTYNGEEQRPAVVVRAQDSTGETGSIVLVQDQDYELSYENNRNAGTASVVVTGKGFYDGRISKAFTIQPARIQIKAKDKAILIGDKIPANGEYKYEISGLAGEDALLTEPLLSCDIQNTKEAGQYDIVPSGADAGANYTISYENGRLTVAEEYVSAAITFDVQGHGTAPAVQIGIRVGGTAKKPEDPKAEGYRFDGWYCDAACTKAWNFDTDIVQADMTLYAKWVRESADGIFALQEIADVYYTGKACKPAVSVYDGDLLLKSGRDYQIKYYNNINANKDGILKKGNGEGADFNPDLPYVEIIGKGNYTDKVEDGTPDTVKVNFNILRALIGDGTETPAAGVTLKISEQLATAKKAQKPFSSIKLAKAMKRDVDFRLCLTVENARDQSGNNLEKDLELEKAEIPAGYEGEFLLTVEGIGNYTGSVRRTIYVADKTHMMKNATITLGKNLKNVEYTGEAIKLAPSETNADDTFTVKFGKTFLTPGRDYTVSYRNHDKVGKAELVITGNGEYVGTKTATFNIKGKTFSAKTVQVSGIEDQVYTGRALTQNDAVLTYSAKDEAQETLQYGTDYTISYSKNINKGSAAMTFKGKESAGYSGSFKKTFKIAAADIADQEQVGRAETMSGMILPYCKAGVKPVEEIVLTNREGFALQNGKDYTLKYQNNKAVAKVSAEKPPTVTVQGKGNYTGKFDVTFEITKSGLKQAVDEGRVQSKTTAVPYNPNKTEDYEYKPAVKLTDGKSALRADTDYEIEYRNNTQADYERYLEAFRSAVESGIENPGESPDLQEITPRAVITAKAESSYEADGEIVVPLQIYQTKLAKNNLRVEVAEAVYTGNQVTPAVTVYDIAGGKTLAEGKDYTLSYGANKQSGKNKGSVTITGTAPEYGGSVTVKFDVVRKAIAY